MRVVLAAARFQAVLLRRNPADLTALITVPLYTLALLSIIKHAGRDDLAPYAVLGSTVIALWSMAIRVAGSMIDSDRHAGRLELLIAAPTPLPAVILGRCATVTLVSLLSIAESVLVARVVFGIGVAVPHVGLLVATLAVAVVAMAGTCIVIAGVFVLARSARIFQNSLSYPFYLLSGAVVPVALLPGWLQPVSKVVFLSWVTDLVRDCLRAAPVSNAAPRLLVVLALGAVGYAGGGWMLTRIVHRVRATGAVSYS